jgi:hypothetical protein
MLDLAEDAAHGVGVHSRRQVATYRAYALDKAGRIVRPALIFEAAGDDAALARARALAGGDAHIEVWQGSRRIDPMNPTIGHPPATRPAVGLRTED